VATFQKCLSVQSDSGQNVNCKQEVFAETRVGQLQKVCITVLNNKVDLNNFSIVENFHFHFNLKCKENIGRKYSNFKLLKLEIISSNKNKILSEFYIREAITDLGQKELKNNYTFKLVLPKLILNDLPKNKTNLDYMEVACCPSESKLVSLVDFPF